MSFWWLRLRLSLLRIFALPFRLFTNISLEEAEVRLAQVREINLTVLSLMVLESTVPNNKRWIPSPVNSTRSDELPNKSSSTNEGLATRRHRLRDCERYRLLSLNSTDEVYTRASEQLHHLNSKSCWRETFGRPNVIAMDLYWWLFDLILCSVLLNDVLYYFRTTILTS